MFLDLQKEDNLKEDMHILLSFDVGHIQIQLFFMTHKAQIL